jgi:hypothetical protein
MLKNKVHAIVFINIIHNICISITIEMLISRVEFNLTKKRKISMKKIIVVTAIAALFIVSLSSCKTHEKCPAYTKVNKSQSEALVKHS